MAFKNLRPDSSELYSQGKLSGNSSRSHYGILYREMELSKKLPAMSDEEKLDLLATHGMLVKRPILVTEKPALVGFKESEWEGAV